MPFPYLIFFQSSLPSYPSSNILFLYFYFCCSISHSYSPLSIFNYSPCFIFNSSPSSSLLSNRPFFPISPFRLLFFPLLSQLFLYSYSIFPTISYFTFISFFKYYFSSDSFYYFISHPHSPTSLYNHFFFPIQFSLTFLFLIFLPQLVLYPCSLSSPFTSVVLSSPFFFFFIPVFLSVPRYLFFPYSPFSVTPFSSFSSFSSCDSSLSFLFPFPQAKFFSSSSSPNVYFPHSPPVFSFLPHFFFQIIFSSCSSSNIPFFSVSFVNHCINYPVSTTRP